MSKIRRYKNVGSRNRLKTVALLVRNADAKRPDLNTFKYYQRDIKNAKKAQKVLSKSDKQLLFKITKVRNLPASSKPRPLPSVSPKVRTPRPLGKVSYFDLDSLSLKELYKKVQRTYNSAFKSGKDLSIRRYNPLTGSLESHTPKTGRILWNNYKTNVVGDRVNVGVKGYLDRYGEGKTKERLLNAYARARGQVDRFNVEYITDRLESMFRRHKLTAEASAKIPGLIHKIRKYGLKESQFLEIKSAGLEGVNGSPTSDDARKERLAIGEDRYMSSVFLEKVDDILGSKK